MSTHWERVAAGRYATEYKGHVLQAIRKDGRYERSERPYIAVVDRIPLEPGEWSLNRAKTKAIHHVQRNSHKAKAEQLFNGSSDQAPLGRSLAGLDDGPPNSIIPFKAEPPPDPLVEIFRDCLAELEQPKPEPEPIPEPEPQPEPQPIPEPLAAQASAHARRVDLPVATITVTILDSDTLRALASLKEMLSLMRELADVTCTVDLPAKLEL